MSNSTVNLLRLPYGKGGRDVHLPVDGGSHIYEGTLVSQLSATAMLVPGSTADSGPAVGVACMEVDNSAGNDGDLRCVVETDRIFCFANGSSTDACSEATLLGSIVYMGDDHTIYDNSASGTLRAAGLFMGMEGDGKVRVYVSPQLAAMGDAASESICLSLYDFREVTSGGDVSNIAGNGGLLASDTTPILRGDGAETQEIAWAAGNADIIAAQVTLPKDFDGTSDVTVDLFVLTDNAGGGGIEAASFTVETGWDGGTIVSDAATDTTPAVTMHKITATIAAADVPDAPSVLTLMLTPGTHANDPTALLGCRINYKSKYQTA